MSPLLIDTIEFIVGVGLLFLGADRFVRGSVSIARHFKWPPIVTGVLLLGFGSSFPEVIVSLFASIKHSSGIAIGNALGSNIFNLGLILGVVALVRPLKVTRSLWRHDIPVMIGVTVLIALVLHQGFLGLLQGIILLVILLAYLFWQMFYRKHPLPEPELSLPARYKPLLAAGFWLLGLLLIFAASELLVTGASGIARHFGLSKTIIGLTVVAMGTSLPELATSLVSALQGETEAAVGNVVGSNVFNLTAVLLMPALLAPSRLPVEFLQRDYPALLIISVVFWLLLALSKRRALGRVAGLVLLLSFAGYLFVLF